MNKSIENHLFQFVFKSFYGLDKAGLSTEFKNRYFQLLADFNKPKPDLDNFKELVSELYKIKNYGKPSLQVSFVSKLLHTVDDSFPIYDSKVVKLMRFKYPQYHLVKDKRIEEFTGQMKELKDFYAFLLMDEKQFLIEKFDQRFNTKLSKEKKIDFILWTKGKSI